MSLDLKKMRERLTTLQNKNNGSSRFWKPPEGESAIRICPSENGDPFKDYWFHYNVGKNPGFLSPKKNFGEDCPLGEFVHQLWNEGTEESKKMAKKLSARQRFFAPVVVRGEEDQGVRVWGFGKQVYEKLLNLMLNPEYGDITDPDSGTDLVLVYGKPAGATYPVTNITPRRQSSSLCQDGPERCRELLETVPDLDTMFAKNRKTTQEVQAILDDYLLDDSVIEEVSSESVKYNDSGENKSDDAVGTAFAELLEA